MRRWQIFSIISIFVLVACQSMEGPQMADCVAGFVKTATGCRSVKSLSSDELAEEDSRLNSQIAASEAELATRRETQRMIQKMKDTEAANRGAVIERERSHAPVSFLNTKTAAPQPQVTEKAALRSELKDSFANGIR